MNSTVEVFFLKGPTFTELSSSNFCVGRTQIHSTPQFFLKGPNFTSLNSPVEVFFWKDFTSLNSPVQNFIWKYFTSLNSPVEVFLEVLHFTELPS